MGFKSLTLSLNATIKHPICIIPPPRSMKVTFKVGPKHSQQYLTNLKSYKIVEQILEKKGEMKYNFNCDRFINLAFNDSITDLFSARV